MWKNKERIFCQLSITCACVFLREAEKEESRADGRWDRRTEGETESNTVAATGRERNGQFEAAACEFVFESRSSITYSSKPFK